MGQKRKTLVKEHSSLWPPNKSKLDAACGPKSQQDVEANTTPPNLFARPFLILIAFFWPIF